MAEPRPARPAQPEAVLGIHLAAGVAYLALVQRPRTLVLDKTAKLSTATNAQEWDQLKQFGDRVLAEARAHNVVSVAFAEPRRYNRWPYYDAYNRAALQISSGLALHAAQVRVVAVAQKTAAATLSLDLGELDEGLAPKLGINPKSVLHWKDRVPAVAVALHVAEELWG